MNTSALSLELHKLLNSEFDLIVDYSRTVNKMIAAGKYDGVGHDLDGIKNFSFPSELIGTKSKISSKLFHFDDKINRKHIIIEMNALGFRSATLAEILALGELYPDLQKIFKFIIGLGTIWRDDDNDFVAGMLHTYGKERCLASNPIYRGWPRNSEFYFLGIRQK
jgi:hypothetical protein